MLLNTNCVQSCTTISFPSYAHSIASILCSYHSISIINNLLHENLHIHVRCTCNLCCHIPHKARGRERGHQGINQHPINLLSSTRVHVHTRKIPLPQWTNSLAQLVFIIVLFDECISICPCVGDNYFHRHDIQYERAHRSSQDAP